MLRHVVMFQWKDGLGEAEKRAVGDGLGELPAKIPQIRRYEFGADAGMVEGNYDFVLVADFDSVSDYEVYSTHPDHLRLIQETIRPAISSRVGAQYIVES